MVGQTLSSRSLLLAASLLGPTVASSPAQALSQEAAVEQCRERVGRPRVMACVQRMMQTRGGHPQMYLETCREPVKPVVMACVKQAMMKANSRPDVPLAIATKKEEKSTEGALKAGFVAPPRTIADITAMLDNEKPDPAKVEERKAAASKQPPAGASKTELTQFYIQRANARAELGQSNLAIEDAKQALATGQAETPQVIARARQLLALQQIVAGDAKAAKETLEIQLKTVDRPGMKGFVFNTLRLLAQQYIQAGDVSRAEAYLRRGEALLKEARTSPHPGWRQSYPRFGRGWEGDVETTRAMVFEARGQLREAEASYIKAEQWARSAVDDILKSENPPSMSQLSIGIDSLAGSVGRTRMAQGRLAEAEFDARRALLSRLKDQGRYTITTGRFVSALAAQMIEQGRYAEAEKLIRSAIDSNKSIGVSEDHPFAVALLGQLGSALNYQGKSRGAVSVYDDIDKATAKWEPGRKDRLGYVGSRITSLYAAGQIEDGVRLAQEQLTKATDRFGEKSLQAIIMRGNLATGHMHAGRFEDAAREFKITIPLLADVSRDIAGDEGNAGAVTSRLQNVVETYIAMLARRAGEGVDVAAETFSLADSIRGRSVQTALNAANARSFTKDQALADMVRKEQDLGQQIAAQQATLNNALAADTRDDRAIKATAAQLESSRQALSKLRKDIASRFPSYAELINPKAPSIEQLQAALKPGEAMLSVYIGRRNAFVWAVPKEGKPSFARVAMSPGDIESTVRKLRSSLEPNAAMISDIPAFDVALAHQLYQSLLAPVSPGWKDAKSLVVVTNGVLGMLPLGVLPTEAVTIDADEKVLFASYRNVPWLARSHAITMLPSTSALQALRRLPPGRKDRANFVAFGDPIFSQEQASQLAEAEAKQQVADSSAVTTRGVPLRRRNAPQLEGVDSAELGLLPRLPDTADELKSIAEALGEDPAKTVKLGADANETAVKKADLSNYKVVAFATHGLVPGELNGLTQPALALSAPAVARSDGDGLLVMEEILGLKLDADWVLLSACNTGAGAGAGLEAASGLGRAFFYAGTRSLLVTNWSVHSQSARELVTDLFRRQAQDSALSRGESLRRAMMALVDGEGNKDEKGETLFTYAHPLFWAPYTIIGEGG